MNNQATNAPPVLAMLWGVVLVAVLYYFGTHMYEFSYTSAAVMLDGGDFIPRYFWGILMAAAAIPFALLHWVALWMLAPSKSVNALQVPVAVVVGAIMLVSWFFSSQDAGLGVVAGMVGSTMSGEGSLGGLFSALFHVALASAIIIAGVYFASVWSRILARTLVTLFAPDSVREHFSALYAPDHTPEAPGNPSQTPEGEG